MRRLMQGTLLTLALLMLSGTFAYSQALPITNVSGRLPQGALRVFTKDTLYQISGYFVVSGTLLIEPGTTVEFLPNGRLVDSVGGKIIADGELEARWNGTAPNVLIYPNKYCDLTYLMNNVTRTGKPEITTPLTWIDYAPWTLFYYANRLDRCATDPNAKNVAYRRDVIRQPIVFRGRPVNQFSREFGHMVILPGADTAMFRNCQFVNFRKDTSVVQSTEFYSPTSATGYNASQILAGDALNKKMRILTSGGGGALTVFSSKTWILDCRFDSNTARYHGGAAQFLQAPFDTTGNWYRWDANSFIGGNNANPQWVVPHSNAYPVFDPEFYDIYGGTNVITPFGQVIPCLTAMPPSGGGTQNRQTYDDGRNALVLGRVRRVTFRDNRAVNANNISNTAGYRDTTSLAPINVLPVNNTDILAKNESQGGAVYISGRKYVSVRLGYAIALSGFAPPFLDPTDSLVFERNYAVNYQGTHVAANGARGGAVYVGDSTEFVICAARFENNFTSVPNVPAYDFINRSKLSQGGGIYMSTTSPDLGIGYNVLFRSNKSGQGGAIYCSAIANPLSDPFTSPAVFGDSVRFLNNKAEYDGGAIYTQRNMISFSPFLTRVETTVPGSPLVDHRTLYDGNVAGMSGGAITIDNRTNVVSSYGSIRRALFNNNAAGDTGRVADTRLIKLYNPAVSTIRPGNEWAVWTVTDGYNFVDSLSHHRLGGGAIWAYQSYVNLIQSTEFNRNTAVGGNGGAIAMVNPYDALREFLSESDVYQGGCDAQGSEPRDQREMTRFLRNTATKDSSSTSVSLDRNPRLIQGTVTDPNRNGTGLGGAIYVNDPVQSPNPGTPRVDSILTHRVRIEQNTAWSGSAVYSDNYDLRIVLNKALVAGNKALSNEGRSLPSQPVDVIANYLTSPAASRTAGATFYGELEGPIGTYPLNTYTVAAYSTNANSIYDNDARFAVRLPDVPPILSGIGLSGTDTLRGNYWGETQAPMTTILPSGTLQNTFYVMGLSCTLPLKNPAVDNQQGPFESPRRLGEVHPSYTYRAVPIGVVPDTLLMEGRIYDIFDKGRDIKAADYQNPRLAPIEDFSVGIPRRLRTYAAGVYLGKVVRRLTRDPFIVDYDTTYAKLQREYVGNHPIGYPLFLESNANYVGDRDTVNDDQYALNNTVFFVINTNTGEYIRTTLKQFREGQTIYRSRVEFVPDSINRDPLYRRSREGRSAFSIGELYKLAPVYYLKTPGQIPPLGACNSANDKMKFARQRAGEFEDSSALSGRRYGGFVSAANQELGGVNFRYINRVNPVNFADVYAGERYKALPVRTGDVIWVISRTLLWDTAGTVNDIVFNAQDKGIQFQIDNNNSVPAPIVYGDRTALENKTPTELKNTRFLTEDQVYVSDTTGAIKSQIFETSSADLNGLFDPRGLFLPKRYTYLDYKWTPLREFANSSVVAPSNDPRHVRLASWLKGELVYPGNNRSTRDSSHAQGFLRFWGTPHNPDVVPGGELLQVTVSNYPPSYRTIDSLKLIKDAAGLADSTIAKYMFLYTPYYNCQVYDPTTARYLQQDTVDIGGAASTQYRFRIFVQDTPPRFLADSGTCPQCKPGVLVANLTNKLRFDVDYNTDDENEDNTAQNTEGWDFRYGRTTYGFAYIDNMHREGTNDTTDDVREIRPSWLANQYLVNKTQTADNGASLMQTGRISVRIDSLTAMNMLRNSSQFNTAFNLDTMFSLIVNDGHTGQNKRDQRVTVNVAPQLQSNVLPRAKEDFEYNPQMRDTLRRIWAFDLNYNQRVKYYVLYRNDALNDAKFRTGVPNTDSNGTVVTNTNNIAYVSRDNCYREAGLYQGSKTSPDWIKINPFSGLLYGTPSLNDAPRITGLGGPETITVVAEDECGLTDVRSYTLQVDSTIHPPKLFGRPPIQCVEAGKPYSDSLCVRDRDLARNTGVVSEVVNVRVLSPAGFTCVPNSFTNKSDTIHCFNITASSVPASPGGKVQIVVEARDAAGNADTLKYLISVSQAVQWSMPIDITNTNPEYGGVTQSKQTLILGMAQNATTGDEPSGLGNLDSIYCEYEIPPIPPQDVFDARWTIVNRNGILRSIFPLTEPAGIGKMVWKASFQSGNQNGSPNFPVYISWLVANAQGCPKNIHLMDQAESIFRIDMKSPSGAGVKLPAGGGVTLTNVGGVATVRLDLTTLGGFKITYDQTNSVDDNNAVTGTEYSLAQNLPNPFAGTTEIGYFAPHNGKVKIEIFNVSGELVKTLVNDVVESGKHNVTWNGTDEKGKQVASGTYSYRMTAGTTVQTRTLFLMR